MAPTDRLDGFTAPGIVKVSAAALQMAREFGDQLRQQMPDHDWVVCFEWGESRQMRFPPPDGKVQDLGPGLDLAAYDRHQVPDEAVQSIDGVTFAIKLPTRVWRNSNKQLIDVDAKASGGLTAR